MQSIMRQIDNSKIWPTIARWWDCIVKRYWENEVIKLSTLSKLLWKKHSQKLTQDYVISRKYLKKYITPTDYTKRHNQHVELQKYISWEKLQKKHFKNTIIKMQFTEIIAWIQDMKDDGVAAIDLIWFHGAIKFCFDNIIVDTDMKLHIIDVALLESTSLWVVWYIFQPLMFIARIIQWMMIRACMKY